MDFWNRPSIHNGRFQGTGKLLGDRPVFNEKTVAKVIVDLSRMRVRIWLLREAEKGWVDYDVGFAKSFA